MTLRVPPVGEAWQGGDLRLTQGGDRPPRRTTMPGEWQYHGDGVKTAVSTTHDLDGRLKSVRVQLDCFKVRTWTEEEIEEHPTKKAKHLSWDDREEVFEEYADGAHATLRFSVSDGTATLESIEPEDGEKVRANHMPLLVAAERVLNQLAGVEETENPMETLDAAYDDAAGIYIDRLDG